MSYSLKKNKYLILFSIVLTFVQPSISQQLVLPGDYPDPSVVKIGNDYWASATTSNWLPAFPLLKSKDLINWTSVSHVFNKKPEWADFYFWAPEISYDNGKVYIYYSAHKKDGNLCLGIASADKPEGPYKDHGPIMCQEVGSIDGFPMRDENGKLYMIWKEDGNSVGEQTPIWAMEMNEARTALIGEKKQILINDQPWESNLIEGVSMIRKGEYFYALYAAAGCCGSGCTYKTGVARAKSLLGPWEKYSKNPLLTDVEPWKCPGHGTIVEKDNRYYFLYHAYSTKDGHYVGRQGLLQEFSFTEDGWIKFVEDTKASSEKKFPTAIHEDFESSSLSANWQWSVFQDVNYKINKGNLELLASDNNSGVFLGHKIQSADFSTIATYNTKASTAEGGIAAIGDENNLLAASILNGRIKVWGIRDKKDTLIMEKPIASKEKIQLKMEVKEGKDITFSYSTDQKNFIVLNEQPIEGSFLPPWDRAIRAGVISKGQPSKKAVFEKFVLLHGKK